MHVSIHYDIIIFYIIIVSHAVQLWRAVLVSSNVVENELLSECSVWSLGICKVSTVSLQSGKAVYYMVLRDGY